MAVEQLTYAGELTILKCWCSIRLAVPRELKVFQDGEHDRGKEFAIFCPLGHKFVPAGKSAVDVLEQRLSDAERSIDYHRNEAKRARDRATLERRRTAAAKGQLTRMRNRVARGVCPDGKCHRSFTNLHDHVATMHPELLEVVAPA